MSKYRDIDVLNQTGSPSRPRLALLGACLDLVLTAVAYAIDVFSPGGNRPRSSWGS